ncbi:hypothetical protein M3147_18845, partial [Agromyces mediolanus]|nr:hypothetical protein [Agromyces mediolanus]
MVRSERASDERADALKERVYATFTGLAIVLVQHSNVAHLDAARATLTLLVGIVAITAAGFVADVIAHLAVHEAFPDRAETGRIMRKGSSPKEVCGAEGVRSTPASRSSTPPEGSTSSILGSRR